MPQAMSGLGRSHGGDSWTPNEAGFSPVPAAERKSFLKALRLLDKNEKHPSLRVHRLEGDRDGAWSASASDVLRMTFERLEGGRKRMLTCSSHYDR